MQLPKYVNLSINFREQPFSVEMFPNVLNLVYAAKTVKMVYCTKTIY